MSALHGPAPPPSHSVPPSGTVTFAFTDIEASTQRWERNRAAMQELSGDEAGRNFGTEPLPEGMVVRHPGFAKATPGGPSALQTQTVHHVVFDQNDPATWGDTPRNAPCPCGSGKKYKHCHGA